MYKLGNLNNIHICKSLPTVLLHQIDWYSEGPLKMDLTLLGRLVIAFLHSGSLTKRRITVTSLTTNSIILTIKVNIQIPFSRLL